jgi:hypothetical protein
MPIVTDRVSSFVVVLADDIRVDDIKHVLNAIRMVKGVIKVTPNTSKLEDVTAHARILRGLTDEFHKAIEAVMATRSR